MTTGGPLPIATLDKFGAKLLLPPRKRPSSHKMVKKLSIPRITKRSLSFRSDFFSAGGSRRPVCCLAAYGGGREVFRGGMAKCMLRVSCLRTRKRRFGRIVMANCQAKRNEGWGWKAKWLESAAQNLPKHTETGPRREEGRGRKGHKMFRRAREGKRRPLRGAE